MVDFIERHPVLFIIIIMIIPILLAPIIQYVGEEFIEPNLHAYMNWVHVLLD